MVDTKGNSISDQFDDLVIQCVEDELQIRLLEEQEHKYEALSEKELEKISKLEDKNFERIVFIKTHKTGSSTIQNIFYRYASGALIFPVLDNPDYRYILALMINISEKLPVKFWHYRKKLANGVLGEIFKENSYKVPYIKISDLTY